MIDKYNQLILKIFISFPLINKITNNQNNIFSYLTLSIFYLIYYLINNHTTTYFTTLLPFTSSTFLFHSNN